mmetsp:Transcript_19568/g.21884  ORF Transcript_19568/g.21884 Transcript_19568/m.21884 type:complete len:264 (-) Transcript_19568:81-872(-)
MVQYLLSVVTIVALLSSNGVSAFSQPSNNNIDISTSLDAVSRRDVLATSAATALVSAVPLEALANEMPNPKDIQNGKADLDGVKKFAFNGVYRDKKHPEGYRVLVGAINKEGSVTMQDTPDGKTYTLCTKVFKDESGDLALNMDFSSYRESYPNDVIATVSKNGNIKFPDGNVWKKEVGVIGVYIDGFAPYPKYRRIIRKDMVTKGNNLAVDMVSGKKTFVVCGQDLGKGGVVIDFPGKTCAGKVDTYLGTISWVDGNVWTKV